jgi:hypothetical protein
MLEEFQDKLNQLTGEPTLWNPPKHNKDMTQSNY